MANIPTLVSALWHAFNEPQRVRQTEFSAIGASQRIRLAYITAVREPECLWSAFFAAFIFTKQPSLEQPLDFWQAQLSGKQQKV